MRRSRFTPVLSLGLTLAVVWCGQEAPSPSPTPTPTRTAEPTATATPSASAEPTATQAARWERIRVDQAAFSIEVPPTWEELSADVLEDEGVLAELADGNPDAATVLEQGRQALEDGAIALFAFDRTEGNAGFAANLNVIEVGPVADSVDETAADVAAAIERQIPVTGPVQVDTTTLPAGDAATVTYEWEIARPGGGTTPVTVVQYAIVAESGTGFILSMSVATEDAGRYDETFGRIAESFREIDG